MSEQDRQEPGAGGGGRWPLGNATMVSGGGVSPPVELNAAAGVTSSGGVTSAGGITLPELAGGVPRA